MAKYSQFKYGGNEGGSKYGLRFRIAKAVTLIWNLVGVTYLNVLKTVTIKWNLFSNVEKSSTIKWNLFAQVSKGLTIIWNSFAEVLKTVTLKWHLLNKLGLWNKRDDQSASGWVVRSELRDDRDWVPRTKPANENWVLRIKNK